jgi:hypothetical protein
LANLRVGASLALGAAMLIGLTGAFSAPADAADMVTKAPQSDGWPSSDTNSFVVWGDGDFKNQVESGNAGGIYAFNRNLDATGWLARAQFTYVAYGFPSALAASGTAHGSYADGAGAVGYQVVYHTWTASGFIGYDYQNFTTNPAAAATPGVGTQSGAIFFGRVATTGSAPFPSDIDGNYSTANNTFWVRGRTGVRFSNFRVGPEVAALGNNSYDELRTGGYVSYDVTKHFVIEADVGYSDVFRGANTLGGSSGVYGGVTLVFFH